MFYPISDFFQASYIVRCARMFSYFTLGLSIGTIVITAISIYL